MKRFFTLLPILFLAMLWGLHSSAQTQTPGGQKTVIESNTTHQPSHLQNTTVAPAQTGTPTQNDALVTDGPVLNDAVINVKDEKLYYEQKKKEQGKKNSETKTDTPK